MALDKYVKIREFIDDTKKSDGEKFCKAMEMPSHFSDEIKKFYGSIFNKSVGGKIAHFLVKYIPGYKRMLFDDDVCKILYD